VSVLKRILADVRGALDRRKKEAPNIEELALVWMEQNLRRGFRAALANPDEVSVIAEFKKASPSRGAIRPDADPVETAGIYASSGARVISVLTEPVHFGGVLEDLTRIRQAMHLPVLRKDFIVDPFQVHQSVLAGADGLLLMASLLDEQRMGELHALAGSYGIGCLVEVHDAREIDRVRPLAPAVVGINSRDLHTLEVDLSRVVELYDRIDWPAVVVAESGVTSPESLLCIREAGFDAVLIGTALMSAPDPGKLLGQIARAGR
jgi:indole-3-glycerol phosphate synthase